MLAEATDVWALEGLCNSYDEDYWFPPGPREDGKRCARYTKLAKEICAACPVQTECLEHALHHERHGIWGGLSGSQLNKLRKERGIELVEIRPDQRTYEGAATAGAGV